MCLSKINAQFIWLFFQDSQDDDEKCIENTGFYALFLGHTTNVFTQYVTLFKLVYSVDWQTHKR